jgi:hypothetical protein
MANSVRVLVTIWNRQYELTAHQHSKAAWIARGDFNGEPLERYGRTPSRAAASWREQAWLREAGRSVRAVTLLPLAGEFHSFLWSQPGPFGSARADCDPPYVSDNPLLNIHVLKGCNGRCLHGLSL